MKGICFLVVSAILLGMASSMEPSPLQDFCVAVTDDPLLMNGKFCKDPKLATSNDFTYSGLDIPGNTNNKLGVNISVINVDKIAGLNSLGISLARKDYAANGGLNPPHIHPRASEIFLVVEGTFYAGFVTSNPNRLITKVLKAGDVFVFPVGLIHFEMNIGKTDGFAIAGLSSQNPGIITVSTAVFGSNPSINPHLLAQAFQLNKTVVNYLQKVF
ncbi:germin-like protein subfamily 1 member 7 isoform X1 [Euphorbia lathyris]|uniref:germin-like protein subfamily 1 member 7 isoform X1 n=1 Tax=Euphorbia lathyris TaxID=212925 RepID=UPI0033144991